jgi:hypothetical protein
MGAVEVISGQIEFSGQVLPDGCCDHCGAKGRVAICYAGPNAEHLVFLCKPCGKKAGL